ncbi:polysaccharide pyruvyl transferase family protein [Candidatus Nomurabacteria bacterium]|nr:polysaccharide pyruvyl transferase family protein [Candidatus Nomurabacteria bacterium]
MEEFDLKKFLEKYRNAKVDFYRFPGNYGDSLIWHGTKILLSELNISENYVEIDSPKGSDILFIDGGGNFVDYYSDVRDFLNKRRDLYREIVILPHTIFGDKQIDTLNKLSGNVTVFCREKISFDFVKKHLLKGNVYLWHDCAFYNHFSKLSEGKGILNAFREDKESIRSKVPSANHDLSYNGYATKPLEDLVNYLMKYGEINTDRLHLAICATLIGKKVNLFPNSYYKNKAVFDYSLKKFPNISFKEYDK